MTKHTVISMEIGIHEIIFHKYFFLEHNFNIKENRIFFEGVNFLKINKVIEWKRNILVWFLRANLLEAINWSLSIGVN